MARRPKLETAIAEYLDVLSAKGRSPKTSATYRSRLFSFASWSDVKTVAGLSRPRIEDYLNQLGARLQPKTVQTAQGVLRGWIAWMVEKTWVNPQLLPSIRFPKAPRSVPRAVLSFEEVERVLESINLGSPYGLRDRALLEVLFSSGLRRAEVIDLRLIDIDTERGLLFVRRGKGDKQRYVPVGDRALWWIDRYVRDGRPRLVRGRDPGTVFLSRVGRAMSPWAVTKRVKRIVERSGVSKNASPHAWRHTAATSLLEGGADLRYIQQFLGHRSISTTTLYTRVSIEKLKSAHRRAHPLDRHDG